MQVNFVNRTLDVPYADHFFHQEQWFLCTPSDTSAKVILRYATPLSYGVLGRTTRSLSWRRRCFRARSSRNPKSSCVNTGRSGWSRLKDKASLTLEATKLKGLLCQAKASWNHLNAYQSVLRARGDELGTLELVERGITNCRPKVTATRESIGWKEGGGFRSRESAWNFFHPRARS